MSISIRPATRRASGAPRPDTLPLPLLGESDAVRRARQGLEAAAASRTAILLLAEPGCDPRGIAEFLHRGGRRREPMVSIDCGAAEAADLDRWLFGASHRRRAVGDLEPLGRGAAVVEAGAGTLFLENVEELPASAQRRLTRLLRDGEARVASRQQLVPLAFRLVASTTHDLDTETKEGRFRSDLLKRFVSGRVVVPALRERPGDLRAIIDRVLRDRGDGDRTFTQPALTTLAALPWTRNLDELVEVLAAIAGDAGDIVTQEDVLAHVPIDGPFTRRDLTVSLREARRRFEREYISAVLARHQWRMSDAAETLGIERANLYRKTRQLGIAKIPKAQVS